MLIQGNEVFGLSLFLILHPVLQEVSSPNGPFFTSPYKFTYKCKNIPLLKPGGVSYKKSKPDFILSSLLMATLIKEKFYQYYGRAVDCPRQAAYFRITTPHL